jgi:hypothetical protein
MSGSRCLPLRRAPQEAGGFTASATGERLGSSGGQEIWVSTSTKSAPYWIWTGQAAPHARRCGRLRAGGRRLDLYGGELLAVDGTRIKAVNNKDRNFTRASLREFIRTADERLNEYLEQLDHGDVEDGATNGGARTKNLAEKIAALDEKRGRYQAMLAQLERTDEAQISLTDPDSRAMATHTNVGVGYNVQVAVDAKNKLIVEQAVTNQVVDMGLLTQTAEPAREILDVETIDVVADRGYFKVEDIEACEKVGCIPHVPRPQRGSSVREGLFRKDEFRYDGGLDAYVCPTGKLLTPIRHGRLRDLKRVDYGNPKACGACPLRAQCTTDARSVFRLENEAVLDRMAERLKARPTFNSRPIIFTSSRSIFSMTSCGVGWRSRCGRELRSSSPARPSTLYRASHLRTVRGKTPTANAAAFGACPLSTWRTIRSRPFGVRRAFLWMSIRSLGEITEASQPSASCVWTEWTTY